MKLKIIVKQTKEIETKDIDKVKHHYFDKNYLVVTKEDTKRLFFKTSTVLEVEEK